jgi:hypothetical protein
VCKVKIILNEADFRDLVAGKIVTKDAKAAHPEVKIALSDIGWDRMIDALAQAMAERAVGPDIMRRVLEARFFPRAKADECDDD